MRGPQPTPRRERIISAPALLRALGAAAVLVLATGCAGTAVVHPAHPQVVYGHGYYYDPHHRLYGPYGRYPYTFGVTVAPRAWAPPRIYSPPRVYAPARPYMPAMPRVPARR
jgi:hypothetical protein